MTWMPCAGPSLMRFCRTAAGLTVAGFAGRKTEFVLLPQFFEILHAVDEYKRLRRRGIIGGALFQFLRQPAHGFGEIGVAGQDDFLRHGAKGVLQKFALRKFRRRAVEHDKAHAGSAGILPASFVRAGGTVAALPGREIAPTTRRARRPKGSTHAPRSGRQSKGCRRFAAGKTASVGPLMEFGAPSQMRD